MAEVERSKVAKYENMANRELVRKVCGMGRCITITSQRKSNCPFYAVSEGDCYGYLEAHPEFRETLIQYLIKEESQ